MQYLDSNYDKNVNWKTYSTKLYERQVRPVEQSLT